QEAELIPGLLFGKAQNFKHLLLDVVLMDSDGTSADLVAVKNNVVGLGPDAAGIGIDLVPVLLHRHGEGMMHGHKTVFLIDHSSRGNSVIQTNLNSFLSRSPSSSARCRRRAPSTFQTILFLSAAKSSRSPGCP